MVIRSFAVYVPHKSNRSTHPTMPLLYLLQTSMVTDSTSEKGQINTIFYRLQLLRAERSHIMERKGLH